MKTVKTVIVMPVGITCNLACRYCYYDQLPRPLSPNTMQLNVLEELTKQSLELANEKILFLWHGGEPLIAGLDFYRQAHDLQQQYRLPNQAVANHMQTNLTLVTPAWIEELLHKRRFRLSTSIDGPAEIHDANRVDPKGRGVLDLVLSKKDAVERSGFPVGILAVVTRQSIGRSGEIYTFLKSISRNSWDYSLCFELDPDGKPSRLTPSPSEAADFLIEAFDIWFGEDNPNLRIRAFFDIIKGLIGQSPTSCHFRNKCADFLSIDSEGNVYPCPRFVGIRQLRLGNVLDEGGLRRIVQSPLCQDVTEAMETAPKECVKCQFLPICGTGCAYQRYILSGRFDGPFYFCHTRRMLIQHINEKVTIVLGAKQNVSRKTSGESVQFNP